MRAFAISATRGKEEQVERLFLANQNWKNLPEEIRLMKHLQVLDLSGNELEQIPAWLAELPKLQHLDLSRNTRLSAFDFLPLPSCLESLELKQMGWEYLPASLFQLPHLRSLNVAQNKIKELDKALGQAAQLECLVLDDNRLRTLPRATQRLTQLRKLSLRQNQIKRLPLVLAKCRQLLELYLDDNQLTALPASLVAHWDRLEVLSATNNRLSKLPKEIAACRMLRKLHLSDNRLKQLPPSLAHLDWLTSLDLSNNKLSHCPTVITRCRRLRQLSLAGNRMKELGPWPAKLLLEEVDLSRNQLSEVDSLRHLSMLQILKINANKLNSFGQDFWNFPNLQHLSAQRNAAKMAGEELLGCPSLTQLEGLLPLRQKEQLLRFLSLARREGLTQEERLVFFALYRKDRAAWQDLDAQTAWRGAQLEDPYFAAACRKFLYQQSARKAPLKQGATVMLVGQLTADAAALTASMKHLDINTVQEFTEEVSHLIFGTGQVEGPLPPLNRPWYSEAQWVRQLDRLQRKKWTKTIADKEIAHLRTLLLHDQEVNCHLALQLMRGNGVPKVLLTELLAVFLQVRFPALQKKLQGLLFPYLPDVIKMVWQKGIERPAWDASAKAWQKWLGTREMDAERLIMLSST